MRNRIEPLRVSPRVISNARRLPISYSTVRGSMIGEVITELRSSQAIVLASKDHRRCLSWRILHGFLALCSFDGPSDRSETVVDNYHQKNNHKNTIADCRRDKPK